MDEEGFVTVVRQGARKRQAQAQASPPGAAPPPESTAMQEDHWDNSGDPAADAQAEADGDDDEHEEHGAECGPADPTELKERWDRESATVRLLQREGMAEAHPVLLAAIAARDGAEQAYRSGKAPHPVARRMGWAQARLDKVRRAKDRTRAELAAFDAECQARRQKLVDKLEEDEARVCKHEKALEELQLEAGAQVRGAGEDAQGNRETCSRVAGGLRSAAPRALALVDKLPEGSDARGVASQLAAELVALQAQLEHAAQNAGQPEVYDIGDGGASDWSESHDLGRAGGSRGGEAGAAAPPPPPPSAQPGWNSEGHGRWQKGRGRLDPNGAGGGKGELPQTTASSAPPTPGPPLGGQPQGAAAPSPAACAADANTTDRDGRGAADDQPASKHRRCNGDADAAETEAAAQDARNAQRLRQQQAAVAAAGFGTADGVQMAAQLHASHVAEVVALATDRGVQPLTADGLDLIMLGPEDLRAWVRNHLPGEGLSFC